MRYLFQGDSITDAGRGDYGDPFAMGEGYPKLLEAELTDGLEKCEVMNCGISGNRVVDLLARWKPDCLHLKPDVLTILIGVNDVWHELNWGNGVDAPVFEEVYRILLRETLKNLPGVRVILMGAYVTHGEATDPKWEVFDSQVKIRRDITRRLAEEFGVEFVDLQEAFDKAQEQFSADQLTADGVHPTQMGHRLIADTWKKAVGLADVLKNV